MAGRVGNAIPKLKALEGPSAAWPGNKRKRNFRGDFAVRTQFFPICAVVVDVNTQVSPMEAVTTRIDALIKASLALHVARSSPTPSPYRAQITAHHEAEVLRCQAELTATLDAIFYPA